LAVLVHGHGGVEQGSLAHAGDVGWIHSGGGYSLSDDGRYRLPPVLWLYLGPGGMGMVGIDLAVDLGDDVGLKVVEHGPAGG